MRRRFFRFLYFRLMGWKSLITVDIPPKCVVCVAPHTSNWDLIVGKAFALSHGIKFQFLIKKFWMRFPMSLLIGPLGGIPVDRKVKEGTVRAMAKRFEASSRLILAVTPEGTRRANRDWKSGFYHIAHGAGVPILLAGMDYRTKTVVMTQSVTPLGDYESDIAQIKSYFKTFKALKPERFIY